jgi:hypothetical protein
MRSAYFMDGFESRRRMGNVLSFDRTQLSKAQAHTLGDLLRTMPGVSLSSFSSGSAVQMRRSGGTGLSMRGTIGGSCRVGWFVDGHRIDRPGMSDPMTEGLTSMSLDDLEAVEVFRGLSEMPAQFAEPDLRCGAIALWTRRG